jgi:hypoxanthine-guanine phosphoribosyltransferase
VIKDYVDYVMIPEGYLKERIEKLAERIYSDQVEAGHDHLDLLVIMNSAFRFYSELISALNR